MEGKTCEKHTSNLGEVLTCLSGEAGLRLKSSKCHLVKVRVTYLGYVVSQEGIIADPDKVAAIQGFPTPSTIRKLRSFPGLASYDQCFILGFSKVACKPIIQAHS